MFDPYQVVEARAWGADCILIIMAAVDDATARDLETAALPSAWTCCSKSMTKHELERALRLKSRLIGINNRDLKTFETTLATSERLAPQVPRDKIVVGESGIFTPADLARLARGRHLDISRRRKPDAADRCRSGDSRALARERPRRAE